MGSKYIQIMGFIIVIVVLWYFINAEVAAITATIVAIWEFLKPSHSN